MLFQIKSILHASFNKHPGFEINYCTYNERILRYYMETSEFIKYCIIQPYSFSLLTPNTALKMFTLYNIPVSVQIRVNI